MKNFMFRLMALEFDIRDFFNPPIRIVREAGIQAGNRILDYGCGPGNFSIAAAQLAGDTGKVFALDILPIAIKSVQEKAKRAGIRTIETILSDGKTGLDDQSLDVVLMYDVFHDLLNPSPVLAELHRVLKPGGRLSFSDHHMKEEAIISALTKTGLFRLDSRGKRIYNFVKT